MIKVLQGQSLIDIAIQELGSAEAAFSLALLNGLSVTDDLAPGRELQLSAVVNNTVTKYYVNKGLKPATGITDSSEATLGGLGFMALGIDFIIS